MSTIELIAYGIAAAFVVIAAGAYYRLRQLPTLEQYRAMHPTARDGSGAPACYKCNASNILIDRRGSRSGRTHICRTCGTTLWRS